MTNGGQGLEPTASRPIALTMGEPAGIGGELAVKAWCAGQPGIGSDFSQAEPIPPPFFLIGDPAQLTAVTRQLGLDVPVSEISEPAETQAIFARALPVLRQDLARPAEPGRPDPANANAVIAAIERAVTLVHNGEAAAIVTNPIQKETLYEAGFAFPGHTEFLADLAQKQGATVDTAVMMLACPELRVVPVTVHLPLAKVAASLSTEMIIRTGKIVVSALRDDFGIPRPRLAVAGLNPHAGEAGTLGREEIELIVPAVDALRGAGIEVIGPSPADSLFHAAARQTYDAALCMYHDQALIPLKTIDFWRGINITLGLPFVRTSPDHGTALPIAGQGRAHPGSLIAALTAAQRMSDARAANRQRSVA